MQIDKEKKESTLKPLEGMFAVQDESFLSYMMRYKKALTEKKKHE